MDRDVIAAFCERNYIAKLALFGSVLRGDFDADSDIDVLVEFKSGHTPGLRFFSLQRELGQLLGRQVDLNTEQDLSPYFRQDVLGNAEYIYVAS